MPHLRCLLDLPEGCGVGIKHQRQEFWGESQAGVASELWAKRSRLGDGHWWLELSLPVPPSLLENHPPPPAAC